MAGLGRDHRGGNAGPVFQQTVEPTEALTQIIQQNEELKQELARKSERLEMADATIQQQASQLAKLAPFTGIVDDPIARLDVPIVDKLMIDNLRKRMIQLWGRAGDIDSEGKWVKTAAYTRFAVLVNELVREGLRRFVHVRPRITQIVEGVSGDAKQTKQV